MKTIHKVKIDLLTPGLHPRVYAVQDDICTREVQISLYSGSVSWTPTSGAGVAVGYRKSDGTVGIYDTLPDGSSAVSISGNVVTVILAAQMLTAAGTVEAAVTLAEKSGNQITTFAFDVIVSANPGSGAIKSEDYFNYVNPKIQAVIEQAAAATTAANTAASRANASAELAEDAYDLADTANQKVDTLREVVSKFHSNIVETATGEVIQLSDASDLELAGLRIDGTGTPETVTVTIAGKNLFPLEPFNPHTSNGITVSYEGCGIRLSGALENAASTGYVKQWLDYAYIYPPGTYTLSFSALCQPQIVVRFLNVAGNSQLDIIQNVSEMKKTITLNEPFMVGWAVYRNAKYDENKPTEPVRIQLEQGRMMSEWEQYKKIQTFTADTPINLTETDLHTNYSNTTIFNDAGADMEVKYVADTKLYVDNKFAELAKALVSNT